MFQDHDRQLGGRFGSGAGGNTARPGTARSRRLSREQILQLWQEKGLRLADNPKHAALVQIAAVLPEDASLQDLLGLVVDRQQTQAMIGMAADPLYANYPAVGSTPRRPGDIVCGVMATGDVIVLAPEAFFCNLGVFGRTGASKTSWLDLIVPQLIELGFLVIVIQQKDEYSNWALDPSLRGRVLPLRLSDFKVSLFQPLPGVPLRYHLYTRFDDLARSYGRVYAQRLGQDIGDNCLRQQPKGCYLPLNLLTQLVERFRPGPGSVEAHYRESILYALRDMTTVFGDAFDYESSDFMEKLYQWKGLVTITLDAPIAPSTFAATTIIRDLYSARKYSGDDEANLRPAVFIIEDATILTDENELSGATSPLISMSFLARKFKIGIIYVGHSITGTVSRKLLSNLQSVFIFGISNEDPRTIQNLLGCTPAQAQLAQTLERGSYFCLVPSFHPQCVLGRFPYVSPQQKLTEAERQALIRPFLNSVTAVKYTGRSLPTVAAPKQDSPTNSQTPPVEPDELKALIVVATSGPVTITQLYGRCRFNRRQGGKVLQSLGKKGLLRVPMSGRTGFPRLTEAGWDFARTKGLQRPKKKTNGEDDHELGAELIEADQLRLGRVVTFEVSLENRRLDVASLDRRTGTRTFFNIGVSDPFREALAIEDILQLAVVKANAFVFVGRDKQFTQGVIKTLRERHVPADIIKSIVIKTFADFASRT